MYARIEVGIFHNRGNLCNEKSGLQQNPFQIRGYSRIENSRIEVLLYLITFDYIKLKNFALKFFSLSTLNIRFLGETPDSRLLI